MIPITFLTGFYVSQVVSRYWDQFMSLPYTDQLAYKLVTFVPGNVSQSTRNKCKFINTSLSVLQMILLQIQ